MPTIGAAILGAVNAQYDTRLADEARRLNVPKANITALALDPAYMPPEKPKEIIEDSPVILMALNFPTASCYPTAEHLFPVIALDDGGHGGSAPKKSFTDEVLVRAAVKELTTAIGTAVAERRETVFRVEYAGHGFTLVVRAAQPEGAVGVELIETVASDILITPSLHRPPFAPATVITALTQMADADMATRKIGAKVFDWDATDFWLADKVDNDPVFPEIGFRWWSGSLRPDAITRWTAEFGRRLAVFEQVVV